jgi:hypothetical protein
MRGGALRGPEARGCCCCCIVICFQNFKKALPIKPLTWDDLHFFYMAFATYLRYFLGLNYLMSQTGLGAGCMLQAPSACFNC